MRKLFSGLLLFFIYCGSAFAETGPALADAVTNHTDLSIAYLAQVFGTVGTSLQGTSGQMLGVLFSTFNQGILLVAGMWLIYTVGHIVLKSAMDGSFMGPNKNVFWIIIRIAIAFAMLIPAPMTGYNIIQDVVMKVVVQGVSLADQTWSHALGYIAAGGALWHRPGIGDSNFGKNLIGLHEGVGTASQLKNIVGKGSTGQQIYLNEVCMLQSSMINQSKKKSSPGFIGGGTFNPGKDSTHYNVVVNEDQHKFYFPGLGNGSNYSSTLSKPDVGSNVAICGSVDWSKIPGAGCNSTKPIGKAECQIAKAAVSQMVYGMMPAARKAVCLQGGGGVTCLGVSRDPVAVKASNSETFFSVYLDYINSVMPIAQNQAQGASKWSKDFIERAMTDGWMTAGRYYWDLSQIEARYGHVGNLAKYVPEVGKGSKFGDLTTAVGLAKTAANENGGYIAGASTKLTYYNKASGSGDTGSQTGAGQKAAAGAAAGIAVGAAAVTVSLAAMGGVALVASVFAIPAVSLLSLTGPLLLILLPPMVDLARLALLFSVHVGSFGMGSDPIMFLHNVGMSCIAIAGDIWIGAALTLGFLALITIPCQSMVNTSTILTLVTNWIKPGLLLLAGGLLAAGVSLGYYLPLYPFVLFTFGVIGWLIAVIEAMVAAPLIAFGLTHPEGHDFLGEAKQALILLLGVFLRPVLMVIGLIAGMILSYVSLRILVYTYTGFLQDVFYLVAPIPFNTGSVLVGAAAASVNIVGSQIANFSIGGIMMALFVFPMMLGIFASLVYVVTTHCFTLIYVLPDYILRWIGGSPSSSGSANMAQQVMGSMTSMGNTAKGGMEGASSGMSSYGEGLLKKGAHKHGTKKQGRTTINTKPN